MKGTAPFATLILAATSASTTWLFAQSPPEGPPDVKATAAANGASEETLIERIRRLHKPEPSDDGLPQDQRFILEKIAKQQVLVHVDALLMQYPRSQFKEEALIIKLAALADLARLSPEYLEQLLSLTSQIAREHHNGRLASEAAFYAIQAFVLGARAEKMAEQRRLKGTLERYEAFLADYPKSEHVPVIRASLVRNLIALDEIDLAFPEFARLQRDYPNHQATRRAKGELYRVTAVGRPFAFTHRAADGKTIRTTDYLGHVLVVHFWATGSDASMSQLPELIDLYGELEGRGLRLVGVNVDSDERRIRSALDTYEMPWPQFFDARGFENEVLVQTGVVTIPTCFVVDRKGILRNIGDCDSLRPLITSLLDSSD